MLRYKIDVIQALKNKGYNTTKLRQEKLLSESALQRLRRKEPIQWTNIDKLCRLLQCQPADLLEYIDE